MVLLFVSLEFRSSDEELSAGFIKREAGCGRCLIVDIGVDVVLGFLDFGSTFQGNVRGILDLVYVLISYFRYCSVRFILAGSSVGHASTVLRRLLRN